MQSWVEHEKKFYNLGAWSYFFHANINMKKYILNRTTLLQIVFRDL